MPLLSSSVLTFLFAGISLACSGADGITDPSVGPTTDAIPQNITLPADTVGNNLPVQIDSSFPFSTPLSLNQTPLAVKTNLLPWAAAIMNLEAELYLGPHFSASIPVWWCPWFISDKKSLRILAIRPEGRWWIKHAGHGPFVGIHFTLAEYNLKWHDIRYQDSGRPLLGGGLSAGYALQINHKWGLEFSIGGGFFSTRYDRYYNIPNGARIDTRQTSYWGIDHAAASVSYRFNL